MSKYILTLFLIGMANLVTAQTVDTTSYIVNYNGTGLLNSTNDGDTWLFNNALKLSLNKRKTDANFNNSWIYGRQPEGLTNNDFSSAFDFNYLKAVKRLYYWGLVAYDQSYSLKINHRLQTGTGVGYTVFNTDRFNLVISDGPLYEAGLLEDTLSYEVVRNSLRLKYKIGIGKLITINGTNFWQQAFTERDDYILKSDHQLLFKIKTWLSLSFNLSYNKFNATHKENLLSSYGVNVQYRFY